MKILIISSYFPYPLFSGGAIRLYNLMKELSKTHEITLIAEKRSKQHVSPEDIQQIKMICKEVHIVQSQEQWSTQNILKTGFSSYPFLLTGHTSQRLKETVVRILREKRFDVIHIETFYVFQNVPKTYLPIVLTEHNIEYEVYGKYVTSVPAIIRPFLLLDIAKMKYWEKKAWKKATRLIAVSEADKREMKRQDVTVVPNGVDLQSFPFISISKKRKKERRILFMGDFKWIQNQRAAEWILKDIWPKISLDKTQAIKLWIVGKHIPESLRQLGNESVIFDEKAPDITAKIYERAHILLAPLQVAGGTSYKILEAMASGVPVVTTNLGVKGLGARHMQEAIVGDSAKELSDGVLALSKKENLYEKIGKQARIFIEREYSWEKITKTLEKVYQSTLEK